MAHSRNHSSQGTLVTIVTKVTVSKCYHNRRSSGNVVTKVNIVTLAVTVDINVLRPSCEVSVIFVRVFQNRNVRENYSKNSRVSIVTQICPDFGQVHAEGGAGIAQSL
jgi:undecaprenyl pyrophosphate synthase